MPSASAALYARWWQLESWLRELLYVDLRARFGERWADEGKVTSVRQEQDAAFTHMLGADSENPLAYLDYSQIVERINQHWELFEYALITRTAWEGRQEELKRIRHKIGHVRRPHPDDVSRLEQTLRDLERGAFLAVASFNDERTPDVKEHRDAVTQGWIARTHDDAQRLIRHAERQYETTLHLRSTRRPWAKLPKESRHAPGLLWKADFFMRGRAVDAQRLWYDTALNRLRPLLVYLLCHNLHHVTFVFSGADDEGRVADAIGEAFDAVLLNANVFEVSLDDGPLEAWRDRVRWVDYRVKTDSAWNVIDPSTLPYSHFGAGGGTHAMPRWRSG